MKSRYLLLPLALVTVAILSVSTVAGSTGVHSCTASLSKGSGVPTQLNGTARLETDHSAQLAVQGQLYKDYQLIQPSWCSASLSYQNPGTSVSASSSLTMPLEDYDYYVFQHFYCNTHDWADTLLREQVGTYWTSTSSSLTRRNMIGGYYVDYSGSSVATICSSGVSVEGWLYMGATLQAYSSGGAGASPRSFSSAHLNNTPNVKFTLQTKHVINGITSYLNKELSVGPIDWD